MKRCSTCKILKPLSEFDKNRTKKDGYQYRCKLCRSAHEKLPEFRVKRKIFRHQYYLKNKEKIKQYREAYLNSHREWKRAYDKKWALTHPENVKRNKEKYSKTPLAYFKNQKDNAIRRNIEFNLDKQQFVVWWKSQLEKQNNSCYYCDISFELAKQEWWVKKMDYPLLRPSIDRMDSHRGYYFDNMVFACGVCQFSKPSLFNADVWKEIALKWIKPLWNIIPLDKEGVD